MQILCDALWQSAKNLLAGVCMLCLLLQGPNADASPSRKRARPASAETVQRRDSAAEDSSAEPASQRLRLSQAPSQQDAPPTDTTVPSESAPTTGDEAGTPPTQADQEAPDGEGLVTPLSPAGTVSGSSPMIPPSEGSSHHATASTQDQQGFGDAADVGREGAGLIASVSAEGSQKMEEHFQPSIPMQEMVVNFLLRMAFVIGGDKEHELQVSIKASTLMIASLCNILNIR